MRHKPSMLPPIPKGFYSPVVFCPKCICVGTVCPVLVFHSFGPRQHSFNNSSKVCAHWAEPQRKAYLIFHSSVQRLCQLHLAGIEDTYVKMDEEEEGLLFILTNHLWLLVWEFQRLFLPLLGFLYFPVAEWTLSKQSAKQSQSCQALNLCSDQTQGFCGCALHVFLLC